MFKYNKSSIDKTFDTAVFSNISEMSLGENKMFGFLNELINVLKMLKNKSQDKNIHVKDEDISALKNTIRKELEGQIIEKTDKINSILTMIANKCGIESGKNAATTFNNLLTHIKTMSQKIGLNVDPFLNKAKEIQKNL